MPVTAYYPPSSASADPASEARQNRLRGTWGLRRLLTSIMRLGDLQIRIWLTKVKITAVRVAIFTAVFSVALVLTLLSVIFFFIGIFRLLTDIAGLAPVWAFLIMGGGTLLIAAIFAGVGMSLLRKKPEVKAHTDDEHAEQPPTQGAGV